MDLQNRTTQDLTRVTLQVLWIGALIAATFWIVRPFLPSLIWAAMIVAATWPLMLKVQQWLWGKRSLAVAFMTIFMLVVFIVPFSLAIMAIFENAERINTLLKTFGQMEVPPPPAWLAGLPLVGPNLAQSWESAAAESNLLSQRLAPYAGQILRWFLAQAGGFGIITLQFLVTVIIAAIFYAKGEVSARGVIRLARRLGGNQGEDVAILAARTVKGVALGVVGTALIQSVLGGIGLAVAGVPAATLLTALIFMLCIAQVQPWLVMIPAVIWLYSNSQVTWGTLLLIWTVFVSTFDNVLRPFLIRKGADLPLFLIFAGVIGGLIAFGIVGLFVGPVVLAVTYRLLAAWVKGPEAISEQAEM